MSNLEALHTVMGETGIAAVIFDLDGVLIDSEPVWEEVRHGLVDERGGDWPADAQSRLMGMSTREWAHYLSDELGVDLPPDRLADTVVDQMASRYAQELPLIPGADAAIRRLAGSWRLAIASSSPRRLIESVLTIAGWNSLFEVTVSADEVAKGKPAPDVYQKAAAELALQPRTCVAVEDSSNGLRSASAAGLVVIAIPRPHYSPAPDSLSLAALVLPDIDVLTVAAVADAHIEKRH